MAPSSPSGRQIRLREERLRFIDQCVRLIERAKGTDRILIQEPDDGRLEQYLTILRDHRANVAETLAAKIEARRGQPDRITAPTTYAKYV